MDIVLAFDGDKAGQQAALRNIPRLLAARPRELVAYECLPGVVMYGQRPVSPESRVRRLKGREDMDCRMRKDVILTYHPEVRRIPDWELEAWRVCYQREVCEAELEEDSELIAPMKAWLSVLEDERQRRVELAEKGAPQYKPGDPRPMIDRAAVVRAYYCGEEFLALFESTTGSRPFMRGRAWKYHCPLHGDGVDRDASGSLNLESGLWHCFGCDAGGDVFQLLYTWPPHLTFKDALKELYDGIPNRRA